MMNDDELWERSFQFRPFAVDVFGAYGVRANVILTARWVPLIPVCDKPG
jgi:hypothetical protein